MRVAEEPFRFNDLSRRLETVVLAKGRVSKDSTVRLVLPAGLPIGQITRGRVYVSIVDYERQPSST